nr:BRO family protein [uncultured Gemmiger sp.]
MNNLQIFNNPEFGAVRAVEHDGEPWFVGKDVAEALGYSNTRDALDRHVDDDDKNSVVNPDGKRGNPNVTIINESGLYSLILSSKLPGAKKFKRWVTAEVLPALRKNGGYIIGQENMTDAEIMAKALVVAQNTIAQRDKRISELTVTAQIMQPKADYFDELVDRNLLTNFRETAKQLGIRERTFIAFLMDHKYIYRDKRGRLMPYAEKNSGLFEIKESTNEKTKWSGTQTLITPKGRETFRLLCQGL